MLMQDLYAQVRLAMTLLEQIILHLLNFQVQGKLLLELVYQNQEILYQ